MARKRLAENDDEPLPRGVSWNAQKQRWMVQYANHVGKKKREFYVSLREAKTAAKARRQTVKKLRLEGVRPTTSTAPLLIDAMRDYLREAKATKRSWRNDVRWAQRFGEALGHLPVDQVTADHVKGWRQQQLNAGYARPRRRKDITVEPPAPVQRSYAPATMNRALAFLKRVFSSLFESGVFQGPNPVKAAKMLREENERLRFLLLEEEKQLRPHFSDALWRIVAIAIDTGLRRGELFPLRREHVNLRTRQITVPRSKNGKARHVDLTERAYLELRQLLAEHKGEWVFPRASDPSQPMTYDAMRHTWEKAVRAAGLDGLHWHDLRHTFASRMVMAGADLVTVKELLGHKTLAMVARYAHLSPGHRKAAIQRMETQFGQP